MKRKLMSIVFFLLLGLFAFGITGCEQESTMEKAGKEIDHAAEDMSNATKETMKDAGKAVEDAEEKVEEAIKY